MTVTETDSNKFPMIKAPKGISDDTFRNVLSAAFTAYLHYKRIPTVGDIAKFCSHTPTTVAKVIQTSEFLWAIERRGVQWTGKGLSPEQQYALSVITNPTDRRDLNKKLKSCGVPYSRYRAWLKQPLFNAHLTKITEDMLGEHVSDVHTSFLNKALSGDMNAIKLYYEMTGRHNPAQQQVVDLQRTVGMLLEIITKYVTDKATLLQISNEIEGVVVGTTKRIESSLPVNPLSADEVTEAYAEEVDYTPTEYEPVGVSTQELVPVEPQPVEKTFTDLLSKEVFGF